MKRGDNLSVGVYLDYESRKEILSHHTYWYIPANCPVHFCFDWLLQQCPQLLSLRSNRLIRFSPFLLLLNNLYLFCFSLLDRDLSILGDSASWEATVQDIWHRVCPHKNPSFQCPEVATHFFFRWGWTHFRGRSVKSISSVQTSSGIWGLKIDHSLKTFWLFCHGLALVTITFLQIWREKDQRSPSFLSTFFSQTYGG